MISVREICEKRGNADAISCIDANCQGYEFSEVGFHTRIHFCNRHKWQEMIAGEHSKK